MAMNVALRFIRDDLMVENVGNRDTTKLKKIQDIAKGCMKLESDSLQYRFSC